MGQASLWIANQLEGVYFRVTLDSMYKKKTGLDHKEKQSVTVKSPIILAP